MVSITSPRYELLNGRRLIHFLWYFLICTGSSAPSSQGIHHPFVCKLPVGTEASLLFLSWGWGSSLY